MTPRFDLKDYLARRKAVVEEELVRLLVDLPPGLAGLREAMEYSLMAGGKRLRPILCMAGADLGGLDPKTVLPTACCLEFIHTYSLIHDDLPAMDDDDLRRGKPTCHKVFGEAMAVLAGDALLTEAFDLAAEQARYSPPEVVVEVIARLAEAAGARGMVGGQVADMLAEGRDDMGLEDVEFIHVRKTGALITVSLVAGARLAGLQGGDLAAVETYGRKTGAAFQIVDDLLDIVGRTDILGKPVGSDEERGKATWPALVGIDESRRKVSRLIDGAVTAIERFGEAAEPLTGLARYIETRDR